MDNNGKDTNNTIHIARIMYFVRNAENFKMYKIDQCEGGLQLAEIDTNNVGEHYLTPMMKYIMERHEK